MLADTLRELRERQGMTQQELATRAGLSMSMVAQVEQGSKPDLRVSTLISLAQALGVPPVQLFDAMVAGGVSAKGKRDSGQQAAERSEVAPRPRGRPRRKKTAVDPSEGPEKPSEEPQEGRAKGKRSRHKPRGSGE